MGWARRWGIMDRAAEGREWCEVGGSTDGGASSGGGRRLLRQRQRQRAAAAAAAAAAGCGGGGRQRFTRQGLAADSVMVVQEGPAASRLGWVRAPIISVQAIHSGAVGRTGQWVGRWW